MVTVITRCGLTVRPEVDATSAAYISRIHCSSHELLDTEWRGLTLVLYTSQVRLNCIGHVGGTIAPQNAQVD